MNFGIVAVCFEENLGDKVAFRHLKLTLLLIYESYAINFIYDLF